MSDHDFWDQRFRAGDYVYGTEPNDFLFEQVPNIPRGRVLSLAEGEGRNAVFLARLGYAVSAVDFSREGQRKAAALAARHDVRIGYTIADLADYEPDEDAFTGVISIFCHLPPALRRTVFGRAARALVPGGVFVIEVYGPGQLAHGTGGPKDPTLLATPEQLTADLGGLEIVLARERVREIHEGSLHGGTSAVTQVVARRPRNDAR